MDALGALETQIRPNDGTVRLTEVRKSLWRVEILRRGRTWIEVEDQSLGLALAAADHLRRKAAVYRLAGVVQRRGPATVSRGLDGVWEIGIAAQGGLSRSFFGDSMIAAIEACEEQVFGLQGEAPDCVDDGVCVPSDDLDG